MGRAIALWERAWFRDASPYGLAAARIVFALQPLWVLLSRDLPGTSGVPAVFFATTPRSTQWRYLLFPGHPGLEYLLQGIAIVALVAVLVGLAPRISCLASALLLYHLAPLETVIWTSSALERGFEVATLGLVVLAFSPCADVWSVRARARQAPARPGWEYHFFLVLVQLLVAQVYLFAAYAKLTRSGMRWLEPANLRHWFYMFTQHDAMGVYTSLGRFIADRPWLCTAFAVGTVLLELAFVLAVFFPRTRRLLVPAAVFLHLGVYFGMNIAFLNVGHLLVFMNWDWLRAAPQRWRASSRAPRGHASGLPPLPPQGVATPSDRPGDSR